MELNILNGNKLQGMSIEQAEGLIENGTMDAVAFGRFFIANPDLVRRIAINAPFNSLNYETLYTWGPEGYSDYPTLEEINGQKKEEFEENVIIQKIPYNLL